MSGIKNSSPLDPFNLKTFGMNPVIFWETGKPGSVGVQFWFCTAHAMMKMRKMKCPLSRHVSLMVDV